MRACVCRCVLLCVCAHGAYAFVCVSMCMRVTTENIKHEVLLWC